ncbi:hypothetical protein WH87_07345 [Devosia epidermidihirudinis]|uniref:PilZ domain-containing protein n=1 Tax=Devosia epidermidihirudinis TaxID=1293439 RepID=A0A0F5QDS1_9HYPH|nr:hypothetical protein WH87_07345 [Devosia epidermidihirudinis]
MSERRGDDGVTIPVHACRVTSISTHQAVLVAAEVPRVGEKVATHFKDFGLLRANVVRKLPTGFVIEFEVDEAARTKLAAKIVWLKKHGTQQAADKRESPRILPRNPRSVLTLDDGTLMPCFVIDVSQTGVAVSATKSPAVGAAVAVGSLVGHVVRKLDVGFAVQFVDKQAAEGLEKLLQMPPLPGKVAEAKK